jgi:hypothetical protein
MNNPVSDESKKGSSPIPWMNILKIALIVLMIVLFCWLIKDYIMPKQEVKIGVETPSVAEFSAIKGFEAPRT